MKILIIGSEGFIGGYMIRALTAEGHSIVGMDVRQTLPAIPYYRFVPGDITKEPGLVRAIQGVDLVINLAAKHHDFGVSREEFFAINEEGTRRMLAVMTAAGVKKLIFYSSVAVYGDVQECSHEGMTPDPASPYGESKLAAERLIEEWQQRDGTREALIIRPAVVFGPNNGANMYKLIDTIYKRRFIRVGTGDNIKSACYVENLVDATVFLMHRMTPGVGVYNYSDYEHLTSAQVVDIIYKCLGRKPSTMRVPLAPVLMLTGVIDLLGKVTRINFPITANRIRKLNNRTWHGSDKLRALGFKQRVTLEEGFNRMVKWYLENKQRA